MCVPAFSHGMYATSKDVAVILPPCVLITEFWNRWLHMKAEGNEIPGELHIKERENAYKYHAFLHFRRLKISYHPNPWSDV